MFVVPNNNRSRAGIRTSLKRPFGRPVPARYLVISQCLVIKLYRLLKLAVICLQGLQGENWLWSTWGSAPEPACISTQLLIFYFPLRIADPALCSIPHCPSLCYLYAFTNVFLLWQFLSGFLVHFSPL